MFIKVKNFILFVAIISVASCKIPALVLSPTTKAMPKAYLQTSKDSTSAGNIAYKSFFTDKYLVKLIDTALVNNQELAITLQEIEIAKNEIRSKHAKLLPSVEAGGGMGLEKVGRYTSQGAGDASANIVGNKLVPEWLPDFSGGVFASWEIDIWKRLRNSKKAAIARYYSSVEGRHFLVTNLVAEITNSYYELLALDNQLDIIRKTITLQKNALEIVKIQKQAAVTTELAVKKFEAEIYNSQSLEYDVMQKVQEKENMINLMLGRFPQTIERDATGILQLDLPTIATGIPAQLLQNRPDIIQASYEIEATKLDIAVARAEFLPRLNIRGTLGLQAFNPLYLARLPESILFNTVGDLAGPIINRNAIIAEYNTANSKQIQALYNYEKSIVTGYIEVNTEVNNINNLVYKYDFKKKEVDALIRSIDISNDLFKSARADYLEVLMTQRDALDARIELVETKLQQWNATVNLYRALGGGWR